MNEEAIKVLYALAKKDGYQKSLEDFQVLMSTNQEAVDQMYGLAQQDGYKNPQEEFYTLVGFGGVKKKDESQPTVQEDVMESDTPVVQEEPISSGSSEGGVEFDTPEFEGQFVPEEEVIGQVPDEFGGGDVVQYEAGRRRRGQAGAIASGEKDTALERLVGKNEVTDFFGDMWRAGVKGFDTGNTIDESLELSFKGADATEEDIQDFLRVTKALEETGPTDEMTAFNNAYERAGGGAWGFISGILAAPTSINEIAITSMTQMLNPATLAAAGAGAGAGALVGSTGFSAGPLGVFTTAGGAIAGAMGAAGATLEAGLSFSEFLQEELAEKGLQFDEAGVGEVLNDPDALFRIRAKSAGRGAVIGIVDGLTAGVAGKITKGMGTTALKAGKAAKRTNLEMLAVGSLIEGAGGGLGEAGARLAVGQEMDAAEIGFEIVGNAPGSAISTARSLVVNGKYKMGPDGQEITREQMITMVKDMDDATFAGAKLDIKGDQALKALAEERKDKLKAKSAKITEIGDDLKGLSEADAKAAIELEIELDKASGGVTRASKVKKKDIEAKLDEIYSRRTEVVSDVEADELSTQDSDPVKKETYETVNDEGETIIVEVVTSKDGRRTVKYKLADGTTYSTETFGKDNDITNKKIIEVTVAEEGADINNIETVEGFENIANKKAVKRRKQELTKQKQDAIQESSTTEVDVQVQAEDGEQVGGGDDEGGIAPEGESQTEVEQTEAQKVAEESGDLEALLSGLSPENLGEGTSGRNVTKDGATEQLEVVSGFDAEGEPVVAPSRPGVEVNENLTVVDETETDSHYGSDSFRAENPNVTPQEHESMLIRRADKAVKAIKKLFPKLKIVMHRSEASYKGHVSTLSRGAFNPRTNTIHINMPKATGRTIGHEVFHAILKAKFGTEVNIQGATKSLIKSLREGINKSTNLTAAQVLQLEKYAQIFDGDKAIVQDEEFLAEFVGFLSETYSKLDVPQQTAVQQWIAKLKEILGFETEEVLAQSDRDVVDLLNTIAGKVTEGQEITESDVKTLDSMKSKPESKTVTKPKPTTPTEREIKERSARKQAEVKHGSPEQQRLRSRQEEKAGHKAAKEAGITVISSEEHKKLADRHSKFPMGFKGEKRNITFTYKGKEYSVLGLPGDLNSQSSTPIKERFYIQDFKGKAVPPSSKLAAVFRHALLENDGNIGAEAYRKQMLLPETSLVTDFVVKGEVSKTQEFKGGQKVSNPADALKTQAIGGFEVSYTQFDNVKQMIKDGLITQPDDVAFLLGQDTVISSPDDMLVGKISFDGKEIHEGEGGLFFVTKYGDVWAASNEKVATELSNYINASAKKNGGKGFLTLVKGTDAKLVSSTSGVNSSLAILDKMLDAGLISASKFRSAVVDTVRKEGGEISLTGSSKKMMAEAIKYFSDVTTTTFADRGTVVKNIIGELAKSLPPESKASIVEFLGGDPKKSVGVGTTPKSQSLVDLVAGIAAEKITKGLKTGDIYAVIEVNGEVEPVRGDHKSYPWHVRLKDGSKPILHLPKNREHGRKYLTRASGKTYTGPAVATTEYGSYNAEVVTEGIKTQAIGKQVDVETYISEQKFFQESSPFAWAVDEVGRKTLKNSQVREYKGTFGVVTPDGDIKGLFNPNVAKKRKGKIAEKGTLKGLIPLLIEAGGTKLDNFDGRLTKLYEDQGFRVVARTPFNEEFAPEGWNKKDHGTPDVVAMVYDPEGNINVEEKTFDEYDDAMAYRDEAIDGGDIKTQIIGQNAELSAQVREDLQYAKIEHEAYLLQKEGILDAPTENMMTPAAIKESTGWELGTDGKWKYEIQDGRLKEEVTGTHSLGDIYDAPEFYKAYPEVKDILVSISVRPQGRENSWYIPGNEFMRPSIEINVKDQYRVVQDLVHELQHFVQYQEGFSLGGSESTFAHNPKIVEKLMERKEELLLKNEMLRALSFTIEEAIDKHEDVTLDRMMTKGFLEDNMEFYLDPFENLVERDLIDKDADFAQALEDFYVELPEMDRRKLSIAKRDGGMSEALEAASYMSEPIREDLKKLGNFAMYERLMGEVEARNVSNRLWITAEKRARKTLKSTEDVAREDQIAFFGDEVNTEDVDGDIKTQIFNPENTTEDIIKFGRENDFSDAAIKDYLVRVRKLTLKDKINKDTKEVIEQGVDTLMSLDADMFRKMPVSFGNIKGGAKVGMKLFARAEKFMTNLNNKNKKRKEENRLSESEIMDQTIEFLESQPAYINEGTNQKAETDQQTQMIIDMQKALGVNPTKGMNTRVRAMRQKMMDRRKGAKGLQSVKRELRNFIRQALPTIKGSTYSKSELMKLLSKVAKADAQNISNLMDEVVDFVTVRQVKALDSKIESILNGKYEVVQSGRLKGVKIDTDTRLRLKKIQDAVTDEAMTAEEVGAANLTLNEEFSELNEKPDQTDADRDKMVDLMTIMSINNAKLMDDVDIDKLESLSTAEELLSGIIGEGKQVMKEQMKADHDRYNSNLVKVNKAITGETIDPTDPESISEAKKAGRKQKRKKESIAAEKGLIKYISKLSRGIKSFFKSSESLEGLMEIIAEAPGEIFGGEARKIVYEGLNAGIRVYKSRMLEATTVIQSKVKEIYGKNWKSISRENSIRKGTGVYVDASAVQKAQEKYDANPTKENKEALSKVKKEEMISLSPNEIAQQWQQYQDPANMPSFANEENLYFGEDHSRIMAELVETIGGVDGKILEMAKWQVEEFYPSMYPHLNEAYKKIYRTNMPWNVHYAGMIKREGIETNPLDLLGRKESFNNQVGAASTKVRIKNSRPIQPTDMMGSLITYTTDMEWFASMGPTIRDIDKLFSNPLMRKAIENVAGEETMRLIDHHMKNIAARGINTERGQGLVNAMNNMFATTRLGFAPNIAIKQLTSIPTYASDIGWGNYTYHAAKNKAEFLKIAKEIRDNSVYLKDRLNQDIRTVTETYSANQDIEFVPKSQSNFFMNTMMGFIKAGDITAIYLGGMPNYSFYKAEFLKANPNATEQQAIDHAIVKFEADTKSTQQSMDLTDRDFYQTSGAFARAMNLFKTSQKQYLRKEMSGIRNMRRGLRDKDAKQFAGGANKFLMYHVMMPVLFQYIAAGLPGMLSDWDEEDPNDLIRAAVLGNFNALFMAGDVVKGLADAIQGKPWADKVGSIPAFEIFADINKNYGKWQKTKSPEKKQEAFGRMTARIGELVTAGKIPLYNLRRMYKNLEKAGEADSGEEVTLRLLNYSDYVIDGPSKSKGKKKDVKKSTPAPSRGARGGRSRSRDRNNR